VQIKPSSGGLKNFPVNYNLVDRLVPDYPDDLQLENICGPFQKSIKRNLVQSSAVCFSGLQFSVILV
jgi:hypothetical protein